MKQVTNKDFKPLNATELETLCSTTKETAITKSQLKKFSVVDLWAIQKCRRATSFRGSMTM